MEKVAIRLIQTSPFYASLLAQMRKIEVTGDLAKQIPTEAVSVENGRVNFYYNPQFLETLTVDEAVGVLTHECNHLIYGHCTRMKEEFKENAQLANIAADLNANRNIQKLPKGACTVDSINKELNLKLKEDDTSENYYQELLKNAPKMEVQDNGDGSFTITMKDKNGNTTGTMKVVPVDSHDKWNKEGQGSGDIPELAKEVIRQAIKQAAEATMKQQGHLPSGMEQVINEWLKPPVVSWRTLLKRFIAASIKSGHKMSWKRPNRRFVEQQKGKLSDRMISITIAIDTSGSIGDEDFQAFMAEMRAIQSCYKGTMTVLECDAAVHKEYKLSKYNKIDTNFKGRGGTSFKPIFEYVKDKKLKTDLLIYFTDLYGDFPDKKPAYPVIWVSTTAETKAPWGHVISIVNNPDGKKK
jgi:predicted metal-dependent peptidase